jgi:hypothetical protein
MTGMPTGEVEADPADGVEAGDDGMVLGGAAVSDSVGAGASVRSPADEGEPGAASVMELILGGESVQALLRREDPRAEVLVSK